MRTTKAAQPDTSRTKASQQSKSKPFKRKGPSPNASALLRVAEKNDETRSLIEGMLRHVPHPDWRGKWAVPAGSFADLAIEGVTSKTSSPPEVAFAAAMAMVSARLIANGSVVRIDADQTVDPTLWLVVLAPSGSAKTFGANRVLGIDRPAFFEDPSSSAGYFDALKSGKNRTLWFRDEFGQLLKFLKDPSGPMGGMKDYILRTYDGERLEKRLKDSYEVVDNPALTIFGITVDATFHQCIDPESLVDGLMQRFNFLIASPGKSAGALWRISEQMQPAKDSWQHLTSVPMHAEYTLSVEAVEEYERIFTQLRLTAPDVPESYFRRAYFSAIRVAPVYHLLLGKASSELDVEDVRWGTRLSELFIENARQVLNLVGMSDLERIVRRVEDLVARRRAKGLDTSPRDVIASHVAKSANEARALLKLVLEG